MPIKGNSWGLNVVNNLTTVNIMVKSIQIIQQSRISLLPVIFKGQSFGIGEPYVS